MISYVSVFLDTHFVARAEMPRNRFKVGGIQRTREPDFCSLYGLGRQQLVAEAAAAVLAPSAAAAAAGALASRRRLPPFPPFIWPKIFRHLRL